MHKIYKGPNALQYFHSIMVTKHVSATHVAIIRVISLTARKQV